MDGEKKEIEVTLSKVLAIVIALFTVIGILALIWAKWRVFQVCATVDFLALVFIMSMPDDWN